MGFDIRMPIGALFSVLGLLLCIYGAITSGSTIYALHSLGLNVNLWWGLVMFFGPVPGREFDDKRRRRAFLPHDV